MNTLQGLMDQIKLGQNMAHDISVNLPAREISQPAPAAAAQAPVMAPEIPAGDTQSLAFNPAQMNPTDLENAHRPLDPERVARLLGLLD